MPTFETARSGLLWGATAVPNAFFCEYMPAAPENHIKVYLYGLMCAHGGLPDDENLLDEMAQTLHMDREEVERAMRYWERCRLVERISDTPPRYRFVSVQQVMLQRQQMPHDDEYEAFAQAVYAAFGDRRKLHGGETVLAYEWVEQFKLPPEVVVMLIQHMIATRGVHFSFKEAQKVAVELCEQRVFTIEAAETVFSRSEAAMKGARKILNHLGMRRNPSMDEMDLYLKWTGEWGFEPKAIREACKETTKGAPTFGYLDKVLEGIHTRTGGKATSEEKVQEALAENKAETAQIRELLSTLGISFATIDDGLRTEYRLMAADGGHELVMLAAREVVKRTRVHTLDKVKQYLDGWRKLNLITVDSVNTYLADIEKQNEQLRGLMELAGAGGGATKANRDLLSRWQNEWHMPLELIRLAAEYAHGKKDVMKYMDRLLEGWHAENIANVAEAKTAHEKHIAQLQQKPEGKPASAGGKRVVEQQYQQRAYDPDEYDDIPEDQLEEMKRL
ncbi:MAG: DnaD domain protein [Clostridia bacterium]|nr:DnaD domain protein [Clostridia bacterium]